MQYLESCLIASNNDMVILEVTKAICDLRTPLRVPLEGVHTQVQIMLSSPRPIVKYAGLKIMNKIATLNPQLASLAIIELEGLMTHLNKSVASMAIAVLLKICKEKEVDSLLQSICQYLPDAGDDFRIDTIRAVKHLIKMYPGTYKTLVEFLKRGLRLYANADFKREIIDSVLYMIRVAPASRDDALFVLADLIEDCQQDNLISKVWVW